MPLHIRALYALLLGNVLLRFFVNYLGVLPRFFNLADVGLTALLALLCLLTRLRNSPPAPLAYKPVLRNLVLFNIVMLLGALCNSSYIYMRAMIGQMIMLNEPLLLFVALVNLPYQEEHVRKFQAILRWLIIFEFFVGVLQFPIYLATGESESLLGTFQHNAEQYGAFLLVGILFFAARIAAGLGRRAPQLFLILAMLALILCIDNKASWMGLSVTLTVVVWKLGYGRRQWRRIVVVLIALAALFQFAVIVAKSASGTLHKFDRLAEAWKSHNILKLGKIKAYVDIANSHSHSPHMWMTGAGPSTFYSRSSRQFYYGPKARAEMYVDPAYLPSEPGDSELRESDSAGSVIERTTISPFYLKFYREGERIVPIGSAQVDGPFSTYAGLLGETGLLGFALYISVYFGMMRKLSGWLKCRRTAEERAQLPLTAVAMGFMIYLMVNSLYGPMLETGRMTTLLWAFVAMSCVARRHIAAAEARKATAAPAISPPPNPMRNTSRIAMGSRTSGLNRLSPPGLWRERLSGET